MIDGELDDEDDDTGAEAEADDTLASDGLSADFDGAGSLRLDPHRPLCHRAGMTLEEIFDRSVGLAWMRQQRVQGWVADGVWWVDPQNGKARLFDPEQRNGGPEIAIQVLGSQALREGHWLWEWGNPLNLVPPRALAAAQALRAIGQREGIAELTEARVAVDPLIQAEALGMIAVGWLNAPGFFRHRVRGVLDVICLLDESWRRPDPTGLDEVARSLGAIAGANLPVSDFRRVVEGLLAALRIPHEPTADGLCAHGFQGEELRVTLGGGRFELEVSGRRG